MSFIRSFACCFRWQDYTGKAHKFDSSVLCLNQPFISLQTGISVGRSNIKTVADKRLPEVKKFLHTLLHSASEILNSDLVITFFHPLLRDQQEADIHATKMRESRPAIEPNICGEIKFSMHYHRSVFIVMVSWANLTVLKLILNETFDRFIMHDRYHLLQEDRSRAPMSKPISFPTARR